MKSNEGSTLLLVILLVAMTFSLCAGILELASRNASEQNVRYAAQQSANGASFTYADIYMKELRACVVDEFSLRLDDESDESTAAIADGLKIKDIIDVIPEEPKIFKDEIADLKNRLKDFDGLILDLRLDGKKLDIAYNAPAIAQELRMIAAEGGIKPIPIILCSTDAKMRATYEVEKICHEHFDYKFTKQDSPPWEKFARKLAALARGYQFINEVRYNIPKILNREDLTTLDPRILEVFNGIEKPLPIYDLSLIHI